VDYDSVAGSATYCNGRVTLTSNYTLVTGVFPATPGSNGASTASGTLRASWYCEAPSGGAISQVVLYADDINLINQANPAAASLPIPNPTPCNSVVVPTTTSAATSTPSPTTTTNTCPSPSSTTCPACQTCPDQTSLQSTVAGLEQRLVGVDNAAELMESKLKQRILSTQTLFNYWDAQPKDGACGYYLAKVLDAYEYALTQLSADLSDLASVVSVAQAAATST